MLWSLQIHHAESPESTMARIHLPGAPRFQRKKLDSTDVHSPDAL